ncbi:MAG TPA: VCBS repeat-containing protein, partial [Proteobacteria bacterium]|nr:VCBS repeat-containing protein [Pseudomonadota bacterium]
MKQLIMVTVVLFCLSGGSTAGAADFNGDGQDDIAIFRPDTGLWAVRGVTRAYFGGSGDNPVPGDYNHDGRAEIAINRPATGLWAVRGVTRTYFGGASDIALGGSGGRWLPYGSNIYYNGRVGIGMTAPDYRLEVGAISDPVNYIRVGSSNYGGILFYDGYGSDSGAIIYEHGADALRFETRDEGGSPSEKMRIDSAGRVGIGTSAPHYRLQLHKNSSNYSYLSFTNTSTGSGSTEGVLIGLDATEDFRIHSYESNNIKFWINNDEKVRITSAGDVGIGTAAPAARLTVSDTVSDDNVATVLNLSTNSSADGLAIKINATTPGTSNSFLSCHKANGTMIGAIVGNGSGGVNFWSYGSDFAEFLPRLRSDETIGSGVVVGIFGGRVSKDTRGADQLLVVSTAPIILGNAPSAE